MEKISYEIDKINDDFFDLSISDTESELIDLKTKIAYLNAMFSKMNSMMAADTNESIKTFAVATNYEFLMAYYQMYGLCVDEYLERELLTSEEAFLLNLIDFQTAVLIYRYSNNPKIRLKEREKKQVSILEKVFSYEYKGFAQFLMSYLYHCESALLNGKVTPKMVKLIDLKDVACFFDFINDINEHCASCKGYYRGLEKHIDLLNEFKKRIKNTVNFSISKYESDILGDLTVKGILTLHEREVKKKNASLVAEKNNLDMLEQSESNLKKIFKKHKLPIPSGHILVKEDKKLEELIVSLKSINFDFNEEEVLKIILTSADNLHVYIITRFVEIGFLTLDEIYTYPKIFMHGLDESADTLLKNIMRNYELLKKYKTDFMSNTYNPRKAVLPYEELEKNEKLYKLYQNLFPLTTPCTFLQNKDVFYLADLILELGYDTNSINLDGVSLYNIEDICKRIIISKQICMDITNEQGYLNASIINGESFIVPTHLLDKYIACNYKYPINMFFEETLLESPFVIWLDTNVSYQGNYMIGDVIISKMRYLRSLTKYFSGEITSETALKCLTEDSSFTLFEIKKIENEILLKDFKKLI